MKRKIFLLSLVTVAAVFLSSCNKSDSSTPAPVVLPAEPAPLDSAFYKPSANTITVGGSGNYEFGFRFAVLRAGKITKLASRMPTAGNYRVTLWQAATIPQTILAQATITQATNGTIAFGSVTAAALETGKDYVVSIWSPANWYQIMPIGLGPFAYPITQGSIYIKGFQWIVAAQNPIKFPTIMETTYVSGMADFEFQPD